VCHPRSQCRFCCTSQILICIDWNACLSSTALLCVWARESPKQLRDTPHSAVALPNRTTSLLCSLPVAQRCALPPQRASNISLLHKFATSRTHNAFSNSSYSSRSPVALERRDPHPALLPLTPTSLALLRTRRAADHHRAVTSSAAVQHRGARRAWVGEAATAGRCAGQTQRPTGRG
jgi:hypothetical protein